jgi:hypothetical protein
MLNFTIQLVLTKGVTWPKHQFNIKTSETIITQSDIKTIVKYSMATTEKEIILNYVDKPQCETIYKDGVIILDQSIEIMSIHCNNILLDLSLITRYAKYCPIFRDDVIRYCQAHNIDLDVGPLQTTKFYHAGKWVFIINNNFWEWYANVRQNIIIESIKHDNVKEYIGYGSVQLKNKLEKLKNVL